MLAVPVAALLAAAATAFAAGAGTPTGLAAGTSTPPQHLSAKVVPVRGVVSVPEAVSAVAVTPPTTQAPVPPTTATPAPAPTAAPVVPVAPTPVATSGACGGNLPPCCVMMRESGGNPTAVNQSSGASGKWQFMSGTWANYGGYPTAASAPEWVQDERAAQIWAGGAGAGHWGGGC